MKILYFAGVRETIGKSQEDISLAEGLNTVQDLVNWLSQQDRSYELAFADTSVVRVAVNQEYVTLEHAVSDQDEIAFFPPVTGG